MAVDLLPAHTTLGCIGHDPIGSDDSDEKDLLRDTISALYCPTCHILGNDPLALQFSGEG